MIPCMETKHGIEREEEEKKEEREGNTKQRERARHSFLTLSAD